MADNTQINTGSGDIIRTIQRTSSKTQVIQLDAGGEAGPESLVTSSNPLPITANGIPQPVYLDDQNVPLDDNGYQFVNSNWDGSDVSTLSAQLQQTATLQQIAAGTPVSQQGLWSVGRTWALNPSTDAVTVGFPSTQAVYTDDRNANFDDDGNPYVNVNFDGVLDKIANLLQVLANAGFQFSTAAGTGGLTTPQAALLHGAMYNTTPPAPASGQPVALQTDSSGNLKVTQAVAALYQTVTIAAAGNAGTVTNAMSAGSLFVSWVGLRNAPGTLTIPAAANSGNEMLVFDYANNAGSYPITVAPTSGAIIGVPVISRNRGILRLLDAAGGYGWLVVG